jgi:ATP-binding cassette, subfamily B, bacterial PglK
VKAIEKYIAEISFLLGEGRNKLYLLLVLFLLSSFLDLIGIGLVAPYVALVVNPDSSIAMGLLKWISLLGFRMLETSLVQTLGWMILVVFVIKTGVAILINRAILRFCFYQGVQLRSDLLATYQSAPYLNHLERNSSEYIYNVGLAATFSQDILQSILRLLSVGIVGLVIVVYLAFQDLLVLTLLVVMLGAVGGGFDKLFKKNLGRYGRNVNQESRKVVQSTNEAIQGFKEIRILGEEKHFHQKLKDSALGYAQNSIPLALIATAPRYLLEVAVMAFVVLVIALFSAGQTVSTELIPTLSMFGVAALRLFPFANLTVTSITKLRAGRHAVSLLYSDLSSVSTKNEHHESKYQTTDVANVAEFQSFELRNVSFQYQDNERKILDNVSFRIVAGESVGLVGESGAGKTTLMDVILGLLPPQQGELILNNQVLSGELSSWLSMVAYLPQDVFLIDGSIRENIVLGMEPEGRDEKKIEQALRQSQLEQLTKTMASGINTSVGEGGLKISGGQKQRIALARAFYHDRQVLVMDESTSALDNDTEKEIIKEIKQLKGRKTTIIIAHRITTLAHCDRIYRLTDGSLKVVDYDSELQKSHFQ